MTSLRELDNRVVLPQIAVSARVFGPVAAILDTLVLVAASGLGEESYNGSGFVSGSAVAAGLIATLAFVTLGKIWGLYKFQTLAKADRVIGALVVASFVAVLAEVCILFLQRDLANYSRGAWLLFGFYAAAFVVVERLAISRVMKFVIDEDMVRGRRVILIGEIDELERLTHNDILQFGFSEVARFGLSRGGSLEPLRPGDRRRIDQAIEVARSLRAVEYAVVLPWSRDKAISEIVERLRHSPLTARLYPDRRTREILSLNRESNFDPYLSVEIQRPPLTPLELCFKRALDLTVASVALLMLAPLLIVVAGIIKLDSSGPVIFKQKRKGFDGREFQIWKFRTMTVLEDGAKILQATRNDQRFTRIGRLLRRTSIDELPQLVNVLKGEMSIVGPRPHALAHDEEYELLIGEYAFRHHVKPGLTGAAQVAGLRGETSTLAQMEARVKADLWYINNWCFWLDVKIMVQTFWSMLVHEAY